MPRFLICLLLLLSFIPTVWSQNFHHQIKAELAIAQQEISIKNTIKLPLANQSYIFQLHRDLNIDYSKPTIKLLKQDLSQDIPVNIYQFSSDAARSLELHYSGPITSAANGDASLISAQGVYLDGHSRWYPQFENNLIQFDLQVSLPADWLAISQGQSSRPNQWQDLTPQEEIYLIAGPFTRYQQQSDNFTAEVYLLQADNTLAKRYLEATQPFVAAYSELIGPYPYPKFALIENFQQTGYGMPSFTLLGSQVIRMPFILHSSYPHEILHNWWGNGVYVDYKNGNWAEGLTSYLADHLIQQQKGQDVLFRRNILQGYRDFVDANRDFALTQFRGRHSNSSEAIGYGKTQMLFHMLRQQLGDEVFRHGLRQLYQQQLFKQTSWDDLIRIFSQVSGKPLRPMFEQWLNRTGAPQLALSQVQLNREGKQWRLRAQLSQQQADPAYRLDVPFSLSFAELTERHTVTMTDKQQQINLLLAQKPIQLHIDPEFDLFRRLDRAEIPAALSQALGAKQWLMVLPQASSTEQQQAWQQLAKQWAEQLEIEIEIVFDVTNTPMPTDKVVWLMGWNNRWLKAFSSPAKISSTQLELQQQSYQAGQHSVLLSGSYSHSAFTWIWLGVEQVDTILQLARKLPHYRKYSYLVFDERNANNLVKGQWLLETTPLSYRFDSTQNITPLPAKPALIPLLRP